MSYDDASESNDSPHDCQDGGQAGQCGAGYGGNHEIGDQGVGAASPLDCLGSVWDEYEYFDQYHGTWTRISGNSFSASWIGPTSGTADLQITVACVEGGAVPVARTNSSGGNDCT